ncbi:hypothetical protein N0V90_011375 [Kalmusia sp. IMI 367209]|nr:hypothetical protein N0V90_011375 [Kalmusia sp. IMI 367209]
MRFFLSLAALSTVTVCLPTPQSSNIASRAATDDTTVDATYTSINWKKVSDADVDATYTANNWRKVSRDNADVDATYTSINWKKIEASAGEAHPDWDYGRTKKSREEAQPDWDYGKTTESSGKA